MKAVHEPHGNEAEHKDGKLFLDDLPKTDFFFDEFIPQVEKQFRIKSEKRYRAVAGLSMGGQGSYIYALHRPDLFSSACPLSAGTGPMSPQAVRDRIDRYAHEPSADFSDKEVEAYYKKYLGGSFLAAKLFDEQVGNIKDITAYSPENPVIFAPGVLAGGPVCCTGGRF